MDFPQDARQTTARRNTAPTRRSKPSSSFTANAIPPFGWCEIDEAVFVNEAIRFLAQHEDRLEAIKCAYVSSLTKLDSESTEQDVVLAAGAHLWIPIEAALEVFQSKTKDLTTLAERSRQKVRGDLLLALQDGDEKRTIAVIEFKNRGHVKTGRESFFDARIQKESDAETVGTLLSDNARVLSQQATVYARTYGTEYVAIFDWDALFLWRFNQLNQQPPAAGAAAGKPEGHFAGTSGMGCYCEDPKTMPAVLLGFLLQALASAGVHAER